MQNLGGKNKVYYGNVEMVDVYFFHLFEEKSIQCRQKSRKVFNCFMSSIPLPPLY